MNILQCKCGSFLINYDVSTGKKVCQTCNSDKVELVNDYEFIKKQMRLKQKIDIFGSLSEEDDEDKVEDW